MDGFLREDDPAVDIHEQFRQRFGRSSPLLVVAEGADVFELAFLARLRALHEDLDRSLPDVDEITSLVNVRALRGLDDSLEVHELVEEWPRREEEIASFRQRVLAHPLYGSLLVSSDGRAASILVRTVPYSQLSADAEAVLAGFDEGADPAARPWQPGRPRPPRITPDEERRIVSALFDAVARHRAPGFEIRVSGSPILALEVQRLVKRDLKRFVALSLVAIALLLFVMFRRPSGVALPLLVVALSAGSTVGVMSLVGTPIRAPTQVLPSLLLAVGVCDAVHVLALFYRAFDAGASREAAIASALGQTGHAIALTSLTTAGGLASFNAAELAPVAEFGVFGPVGVAMAFVQTVTTLPALIALLPLRRRPTAVGLAGRVDGLLSRFGRLGTRHPRAVIAACVALIVVSGVGAARVRLAHDPLLWLRASQPFRVDTERIDALFRAVMAVEIAVDSGEPEGLHEPAFLTRLEALAQATGSLGDGPLRAGATHSVADLVKEIHLALHDERPELYAIPDRREAVAQELLLFEASDFDDLARVTSADRATARLTVRIPWVDAVHYPPFLDALEAEIDQLRLRATLTGSTVVMARTVEALMQSLVRSYALCFLVITPLMMLLIGSLRSGLVSALPNLTPIVLTLGLMGWLDVPLDAFTLLVACIAIGLAVDDTIHLLLGFEHFRSRGEGVSESVELTLVSTGRALLVTSAVLVAGFLVFGLASMANVAHFGLLVAFAITTAFLADVILTPALLRVLHRG